jgi:hypothetical protein
MWRNGLETVHFKPKDRTGAELALKQFLSRLAILSHTLKKKGGELGFEACPTKAS